MNSDRIESIRLLDLIPCVFTDGGAEPSHRPSQVWRHSLTVSRGDRLLLEAESGLGKSSLCSFIYGLRGDYSGQILFDDTDITTFGLADWCRLRRQSLAYLPQQLDIFPELTVMENIELKNSLTSFKSHSWIRSALEALEIDHKADTPARLLSLGQQQRMALVRTLCQPFSFLLLDEPVSHLDSRNNSALASLIADEADAQGAAVIATSVGNNLDINFTHRLSL